MSFIPLKAIASAFVLLVLVSTWAEPAPRAAQVADAADDKPAVVELIEDEPEALIRQLVNADNGSAATRDDKDKFTGSCSIRVTPLQRYNTILDGWKYPIVEKPQPGEYRYIRFAWKKVGGRGIMVQFHTGAGSWEQRFVAGVPTVPWPARKVAEQMPGGWEVVTRDLFKEFGGFVLTGLALTPMDGTAGLYDHMYLGRTIEDLDKVTNALTGKLPPEKDALTAERLRKLYLDLTSSDPSVSAPASAILTMRPAETVPFFQRQLPPPPITQAQIAKIDKLIDRLEDNDYQAREQATEELEKLGVVMVKPVRDARALRPALPLETHRRIERVLRPFEGEDAASTPQWRQKLQAIRILERVGSAEAKTVLEKVREDTPEAGLQAAAAAALERLARRTEKR
ncbi:MAG: hypothetical protein K2R98_06685 [Gemmataceae bacterium]|nr:hypothetical protein [Gemmataceae bacterium]